MPILTPVKIYQKYLCDWLWQVVLALLVLLAAVYMLQVDIGKSWRAYLLGMMAGDFGIDTHKIPSLVLGAGMILMSFGLFLQSRIAWVTSIFLLFMAALSVILTQSHSVYYLYYCIGLLVILLACGRLFTKSSLLASAIFASTSVLMVMAYATFGNFYLGQDFKPPIEDLTTSLYYSMVTMSTVGYGDIIPQTPEAKLFSVSVIIAGLTVFATSITSVVAPLVNAGLHRAIHTQGAKMKRKNHFVVIGNTALAINTCQELGKRGHDVTRILPSSFQNQDIKTQFDTIFGAPDNLEVLREAGVAQAAAVISMLREDPDNAFVILAVQELNPSVKTIVSVTDSQNLTKINLVHPDVIISPQVFGGELTAMLLSGEEISSDFVMTRLFRQTSPKS